jgi:DNA polymerase III epsilon subunit-like protein
MANFQKICVFDLETDGKNPEVCSPVQIAALIIDPIRLEIVKDSEFNINMRPESLDANPNYAYEDSDVLDFHAKVKSSTKDQVLAEWKTYQKQEQGWKLFISYLDMYHTRNDRKSLFSAPIASGFNINRYDLRITDRLSKKYKNVNKEGTSNLFYPRDVIDVMNLIFYWFEGNSEVKSYTLDNLRDYFGISKEGGHDALKDVRDTADILIRFLKLHRTCAKKVTFKGSFANKTVGNNV